ncbi:MAG TPA: RNA 2',3'-cyclic phosphodiesterase [Alphaproteobacteria bacterium]
MTESWRCFVAVPIGETLREALVDAVERWRARPDLDGLRWSNPGGWHVTLAFLGAVEADAIPDIRASIADVAAASQPLELEAGRVGGFPSARRARVAWYGVADPDGALAEVAARLRDALGLDAVAPFRPHLTLGRARGEPVDLSAWREAADEPSGILEVTGVELMRSHLGRGPARYEIIGSMPLGAPAHV